MNHVKTISTTQQTPSLKMLGNMLLRAYRTWKLERKIAFAEQEYKEGKTLSASSADDIDRILA